MLSQTRISKFLSLVLRHRPDLIGLRLDEDGWGDIGELIEKTRETGLHLTPETIIGVVETNDKQRFAISDDGSRIRSNQGHSIQVNLGLRESVPPEYLYHGTVCHNLAAIRAEGIQRGKRLYVHLSLNREIATMVGKRHGIPVVLIVQSIRMYHSGFSFYLSENGVWMTEHVPAEYIQKDT